MGVQNRLNNGKISLTAGLLLLLVCAIWGGNAVSIKFSNQGIPPLLAATIRSVAAGFLVLFWAKFKGQDVVFPKGARRHGVMIGLLFGLDFLFLYWSVSFTTASRATIFLYSHPFWVALGAHFILDQDRLRPGKAAGLILAFVGLWMVFRIKSPMLPENNWIGDVMGLAAGVFWAATTLYIKRISQTVTLNHYQTLFSQLIFAIPVLLAGSLLFEHDYTIVLSANVLWAMAYQIVVVAFFSYTLWFWMIHNFAVSGLTAFTFLAPLFGVIFGAVILSEPVGMMVWFGLALVCTGIYLVNRSPRGRPSG
ncbi:MAG: DMT family transporter [Desulfotignum sp.]|jgi:drug/metabolite transporter (DMT)-like permease|nr:DMT family transporter [Desulfotignum sp.]